MQKLAEVCIRRPVFATMMNLTLVIIGLVSVTRLGVDRLPSVDLPTVRVITSLPGASPEEIESEVTDIIEEAVNTVEGIEELRSISNADRSIVIATFGLHRNIDAAAQDVRDRVQSVLRDLPDDAEPPTVGKVDNDSDPVITIAVTGPRDLRELTEIADRLVRVRLERSTGVGEIRVQGGLARTMNIWMDADRLDALGIPITAVRDAIRAQNANVPGGNVTGADREFSLRTAGRLFEESSFSDLIVATRDGVPIRIRDLGRAEDGTAEQRTTSRLNGTPTVVLEIIRQSGANSIEVIEGVRATLADLADALPEDVRTVIIQDQSRFIRASLHEIRVHLVLGSICACGVVLLFMRNWRSTVIAAVAIPTSLIATFGMMEALGFTLNTITMLALVLMVGIVIDDAIVVLENIFRFIEEKGMHPLQAAREATREIGLAVLATTLSLAVIFVPVSFMSSVAGRFLYQFGITAAVAILVSLFVSFSLTPMMASRMLRPVARGEKAAPRSRSGLYAGIDRVYVALIRWAMRHRLLVCAAAVGVILLSYPAFHAVGRELVPGSVDEAEFNVSITAPEGTSMPAMNEAMIAVEDVIRSTRGVRDVLITAGSGGGAWARVNTASAYVRIAPHEERVISIGRLWRDTLRGAPLDAFRGNYSQADVMTALDRRLRQFSELRCQVRNFPSFNIGGGPFEVNFNLRGPELERLSAFGEELRARASAEGGFRGLDTSLRLNKPELQIDIDRDRAADLGLRARDIGVALRLMVGGAEEVSRFRDPQTNEQYQVRLRLTEESRNRPDIIDRLRLAGAGGLVELSSVAHVAPILAASRIDRVDRQRIVSVRGGVAPGYALADRLDVLRRNVREMDLPPGYTTSVSGRSRELERTFNEFILAFALSMVFMYLILASQFESISHPFTILLSVPISVPFALFSLWLTGGTLNIFSLLGMLVLFGVVKKNAILQIDHMNQLRRAGVPRLDAVIQGNRDRLRPILMTTLSLIGGMMPLALGTGPGAEERQAVAVVVIGGQALCLVLTLLVTPVVYSLLEDLGAWLRRAPAAVPARAAGVPAQDPTA